MLEEDSYFEDPPLPKVGKKTPSDPDDLDHPDQHQDGGEKNGTVTNVGTGSRVAPRVESTEPHHLMLLYDLFFAANMTAFSNIHDTTSVERLVAYIGYFLVLWSLWLNVMLFDVRFVVDSISERILRAIHLGAMVGVSVVAPQYNPAQQVKGTFQAFSIILMVSRLALAAQYGLAILREPRESKDSQKGLTKNFRQLFTKNYWKDLHKDSREGLAIMSLCHAAAAMIYLGITFRFRDSTNSRVFVTWYIVGFAEAVLIFLVSHYFKGLSFKGSLLPDRMKTATLLILGEGVIVVAEHVGTVVKNVNSWTSETIGVLTATVALIYVIFQIYFDWSWPTKKVRPSGGFLYVWSLFHLPFHLALVLVMEGATQFVVWWKIVELIKLVTFQFDAAFTAAEDSGASSISASMADHLSNTINGIWADYPPELLVTIIHKDKLLEEIRNVDDSYWLHHFASEEEMAKDPRFLSFTDKYKSLQVTVLNSIFTNFNIEEIQDSAWEDPHPDTYEERAFKDASDRFELVYIYVFCFAGAALILMAILHILSRPTVAMIRVQKVILGVNIVLYRPKLTSTWIQKVVLGVNIVLGMGLMLLASMSRADAHDKFTMTPWIIPTIFLIFLIALILIHTTRRYGPDNKGRGESSTPAPA